MEDDVGFFKYLWSFDTVVWLMLEDHPSRLQGVVCSSLHKTGKPKLTDLGSVVFNAMLIGASFLG